MRIGKMHEPGDVILAQVQFTDTFEVKKRPALVLFQELGNVVVAGITSNQKMQGIPLLNSEGSIKDSVIKTNYIFTISENMIEKTLFSIPSEKKKMVYEELISKLKPLNS